MPCHFLLKPVLVRHMAVQSVIETCLTLTHDVVPSCHFTTCLPFVSVLVQASSGMGVPLDDRVDIARLLDVTGLGEWALGRTWRGSDYASSAASRVTDGR